MKYSIKLLESILLEDEEGNNINKAEKWVKQQNLLSYLKGQDLNGKTINTIRDIVSIVRSEVPASRLPLAMKDGKYIEKKLSNGDVIKKGTCRWLLAACRIYFTEIRNRETAVDDVDSLNDILYVIAKNHANEFVDSNLRGMPLEELKKTFSNEVSQLKANERANVQSKTSSLVKNKEYTIIPIETFDDAKKYSQYVSWCVTRSPSYFSDYTHGYANRFYFCLKNGFEQLKAEKGEKYPLDEYGTSMLAILVKPDGSMDSTNGCTCRWNCGGRVMEPSLVLKLLGVDFYKTFLPTHPDKIEEIRNAQARINKTLMEFNRDEITKADTNEILGNYRGSIESIELPKCVKKIGDEAFANCSSLKSLKLHDGLQHIGKYAFSGCLSLASMAEFENGTSVKIPSTVKYIGDNAFATDDGQPAGGCFILKCQIDSLAHEENGELVGLGSSMFGEWSVVYVSSKKMAKIIYENNPVSEVLVDPEFIFSDDPAWKAELAAIQDLAELENNRRYAGIDEKQAVEFAVEKFLEEALLDIPSSSIQSFKDWLVKFIQQNDVVDDAFEEDRSINTNDGFANYLVKNMEFYLDEFIDENPDLAADEQPNYRIYQNVAESKKSKRHYTKALILEAIEYWTRFLKNV